MDKAGIAAQVRQVIDSKKRGLMAQVSKTGEVSDGQVGDVLGKFVRPWEWAE